MTHLELQCCRHAVHRLRVRGVQSAHEDAAYLAELQSQVEQLQATDAGDVAALRGIEAWPQPA